MSLSIPNYKGVIHFNALEFKQVFQEIAATVSNWSGFPETPELEIDDVERREFFVYQEEDIFIGILSLHYSFSQTAHIDWIAVHKHVHHKKIEQLLLHSAEMFCLEQKRYSLTVEIQNVKEKKNHGLQLEEFYLAAGFKPFFQKKSYDEKSVIIYLQKVISPNIFKWIDLTHNLSDNIPTWDGGCGFQHRNVFTHEECTTEFQFLVQRIEMLAGIGTHLDAPLHCFPHRQSVAEIPLHDLISPCFVIDVSTEAHEQYQIDMEIVKRFEQEHGKIIKQAFVIFYTGWDRFWHEPEKYHNHYCFPSITKEVAEYLISKDIRGIGIDTLSPDRPESGYPVHQIILEANRYIVENMAHVNLMPRTGGYCLVLPMRIAGGSEAPARVLGCFQK